MHGLRNSAYILSKRNSVYSAWSKILFSDILMCTLILFAHVKWYHFSIALLLWNLMNVLDVYWLVNAREAMLRNKLT